MQILLGPGRPDAEKLFGAVCGEAAPFRSTLLPPRERSSRIAMRRPHAALGALSQPTEGDRLLHDVSRQPALAGQIAPGWRAEARLEALSPPLCNGRKDGLWPCRTLPCWCTRNEANHIRNTAERVRETAGAEMFGKRKHVPFRGRQGIEPAAAFVDDDDDIAVTAILDRASGTFLDVDLPAIFFQQGRATDLLAQFFDFSFVHLSAPDSRGRVSAPFLRWSLLLLASRNVPDRPRSLPNARAR